MKRRTKKKPSPQPDRISYPTTVVQLAQAFQAGEDCGHGLHDALLEAGYPGLAEHFAGDFACRPGTTCLAIEEILDPRPSDPDDPTAAWASGIKRKPRHRGYGQEDQDLSTEFGWVCRDLESQGVARVEVLYDGNGDSGTVEGFTLRDRDGQEVDPARLPTGKYASGWAPGGREIDLADKLDELVCAILPGGWEINEGSFGVVVLNTLTRRIHVAHSWRIESTQEEPFELEL